MSRSTVLIIVLGLLASQPAVGRTQSREVAASEDKPLARAWAHWAAGDIKKASQEAVLFLNSTEHRDQCLHLLVLTALVNGKYESALSRYEQIDADYTRLGELDEPLLDAYLHLGRYAQAEDFARTRKMPDKRIALLAEVRQNPLKVSLDKLCVVPFAEHPLGQYFPAFETNVIGSLTVRDTVDFRLSQGVGECGGRCTRPKFSSNDQGPLAKPTDAKRTRRRPVLPRPGRRLK